MLVELRGDRVEVALAELDAVEGVPSGLFERAEIVSRAGVRCWVYVWPNSTEGFEPVGEIW